MRRVCKVMGAHLRCFGHQPVLWNEALLKLQEAEQLASGQGQERLYSSLHISYAALEVKEQRMFLDAACLLLGRRAVTAKRMWSGCAALNGSTPIPCKSQECYASLTLRGS